MTVLAPCNQRIDAFCRFRSVSCLVLFHCRPLNGNGKFIILCVLCGSSEAGGEYKLTYLHSKAGTFSLAEGLMDQLKIHWKEMTLMIRMIINFTYQFSLKSEPRVPIYCVIKGLK
jgi:hypothetical protein